MLHRIASQDETQNCLQILDRLQSPVRLLSENQWLNYRLQSNTAGWISTIYLLVGRVFESFGFTKKMVMISIFLFQLMGWRFFEVTKIHDARAGLRLRLRLLLAAHHAGRRWRRVSRIVRRQTTRLDVDGRNVCRCRNDRSERASLVLLFIHVAFPPALLLLVLGRFHLVPRFVLPFPFAILAMRWRRLCRWQHRGRRCRTDARPSLGRFRRRPAGCRRRIRFAFSERSANFGFRRSLTRLLLSRRTDLSRQFTQRHLTQQTWPAVDVRNGRSHLGWRRWR